MKSVLLYIADDTGLNARLQAALDLTRSCGGHLHCLRANPFNSQVAFDGVSGLSVMYDVSAMSRELDKKLRAKIEERLAGEDVSWDYREEDAEPARGLSKNSALVDVIILSSAGGKDGGLPLGILGDVLFNSSAPIVVQPDNMQKFNASGPALVAWNGSFEAGNALRASVPLLKMASDVHILTVEEEDKDHDLPQLAASEYLAYHGIKSEILATAGTDDAIAASLLSAAASVQAEYMVMGAYGQSRAREFLFGGVTRNLFKSAPLPLVVSH